MADTEYSRLIHAAKEKALSGFLSIVQHVIQDADKNTVDAKSGLDRSALTAVRHFLRQDGSVFLGRIDTLYRGYLERAMQTMYTDLRPDMRKLSASELSLVNDEAVNQQIEVGRLTQRVREADEEVIGRLNVIVANLHGKIEARERENPFRPYLLARALFEAVRETVKDEATEKALFEYLAAALIPHLAGFYAGIQEVFEASGVRGKFIAQRSRAAHNQRYFGAPAYGVHGGALADATAIASRALPSLNRLLETLQHAPDTGGAGAEQLSSVQTFLRSMFSPERREAPRQHANNSLIAQLGEYQQQATSGEPTERELPPEKNQLNALRERLDLDHVSLMERMTVEVVAMLFEIILDDEQTPAPLRQHIARLQIPTLKAALLEPDLMHDSRHPARRLLNRMNSAAIAADPASPSGKKLAAVMERVGRKVLEEFKFDMSAFADSESEFESLLAQVVRDDDRGTAAAIEAVEASETYSVLLTNTTRVLCDVLLPLNIDKRISDFIITVWPHVLVQAAWRDADKEEKDDKLFGQYLAVLPELIWSVQEKSSEQERSALVKLLPDLVRRLRAALQMIQLPEDEPKPLLDFLVATHTKIMRAGINAAPRKVPDIDQLRQQFARVAITWGPALWALNEPPPVRESAIEDVFARTGVSAELNLGMGTAATAADRQFLAQTCLPGTRIELRGEGGARIAQLVWISTHRSLYLFRSDADASLFIYSAASLLEALDAQEIVPLEYAPVFERAVESLLSGVENVNAAK